MTIYHREPHDKIAKTGADAQPIHRKEHVPPMFNLNILIQAGEEIAVELAKEAIDAFAKKIGKKPVIVQATADKPAHAMFERATEEDQKTALEHFQDVEGVQIDLEHPPAKK